MSEFFSRLIGILMLRNGPQDLPAGSRPLTLALACYVVVTALSLSLSNSEGGPANPITALALATLLPMVLIRIVLGLRAYPARWAQTVTALFGSSALISLLSLPLGASAGSEPGPIVVAASLVLFFWSFAVDAHIWRHALDTSFAAGLAVAVLLFAISMYLITAIAGPL